MSGSERDPRYIAARPVAEPVLEATSTMHALSHTSIAMLTDANALRLLGIAAHAVGDSVRATDILDSAEILLRDQGRLGLLLHVLGIQVNLRLELGDFTGAERATEQRPADRRPDRAEDLEHRHYRDRGQMRWTPRRHGARPADGSRGKAGFGQAE